jgi:hypothetical protein
MNRKLKSSDILRILREEWTKKHEVLRERIDLDFAPKDGSNEDIISAGLKVKQSKTGQLYTVHAISNNDIELETPEKELFTITREELGTDYDIA